MKRVSAILIYSLILVLSISSIYFFRTARTWIDKPFPGYLTFENGMVGAFNQFDWSGYKVGMKYHDIIESKQEAGSRRQEAGSRKHDVIISQMIFSLEDFLKVFFLPFLTGIIYLILAVIIFIVAGGAPGIAPFVLFHLGLSYYMFAVFDFHTTYTASWLFLAIFALLPAFMTHFALVYPEPLRKIEKKRTILILPYFISALVYIPYCYTFYYRPSSWELWEAVAVGYSIVSYLFWMGLLGWRMNQTSQPFGRITAKYLLTGQILAFIIPLTVMIAVFTFRFNLPLNLIMPVTIALPIASLFGLILGNLRKTQLQLVQSEKMASLGQLVAGVAHEINNPTTFIYSNIEPLKDYANYLETAVQSSARPYRGELSPKEVIQDLKEMILNIEEGARRTKEIVSDLRRFAHSTDDTISTVDINAGIESTLHLLKHKLHDRIIVHKEYGNIPKVMANAGQLNQVWMNLLKNAIDAIEDEGEIWIKTSPSPQRGEGRGEGVIIEIRDNGIGIPHNILPKIFDPFFTTKPEGEGTGLGLSICQQIVNRWQGSIEIFSASNDGTTVRVTFNI